MKTFLPSFVSQTCTHTRTNILTYTYMRLCESINESSSSSRLVSSHLKNTNINVSIRKFTLFTITRRRHASFVVQNAQQQSSYLPTADIHPCTRHSLAFYMCPLYRPAQTLQVHYSMKDLTVVSTNCTRSQRQRCTHHTHMLRKRLARTPLLRDVQSLQVRLR